MDLRLLDSTVEGARERELARNRVAALVLAREEARRRDDRGEEWWQWWDAVFVEDLLGLQKADQALSITSTFSRFLRFIWQPVQSAADFLAREHQCKLCKQSPIEHSLRYLGRRFRLCDSLSELREKAKVCDIYRIMLSSIESYGYADLGEIKVFAKRLVLSTEGEPGSTQPTSIARVFADLGQPAAIMGTKREIPILPEARSQFDFLLYREWLRVCDSCHKHTQSYVSTLPTRVIDVECYGDSDSVRLRVTNGHARGIYIALSHRWQNNTPTTTTVNVLDQRKAIKLDSLSQTIQDVVRIIRNLGIRFVWIDSLCIFQNSSSDWEFESRKMDDIFSSAYCTIAVISAGEEHGSFEQDVENGELSRRGWIFQERALSHRTIHLTGQQTYWECGSAIWSKIHDDGVRPRNLLGSSNFPRPHLPDALGDAQTTFQDVFTRFSRLELTQKADRPIAIAGLEYRMMDFYGTTSVHGIVHSFFGQSLLWQRAGDKWMEPLNSLKRRRVPSWSWMAYTGEIRYGTVCTDGLIWRTDFKLNYNKPVCSLAAPLMRILSKFRIVIYGDIECEARDEDDGVVGWIRYDCSSEDNIECLGFISIAEGTTGWRKYMGVSRDIELLSGMFSYSLVLKSAGRSGVLRRVGVAVILGRYLSPGGDVVVE